MRDPDEGGFCLKTEVKILFWSVSLKTPTPAGKHPSNVVALRVQLEERLFILATLSKTLPSSKSSYSPKRAALQMMCYEFLLKIGSDLLPSDHL